MAGPGGGKSPGPRGSTSTSPTKSWSSIASMNVSKRNKTNTLEVRLENDEGYGFSLKDEEIERLLRRLNIQVSQFTSVQACPERRNVVYITLTTGIDITKFINTSNESFILKQGIRTTSIKPVNKREVNVQVFGLHPDTKDEAVIHYLNAHGNSTPSSQSPMEYFLELLDPLSWQENEMETESILWKSRRTLAVHTSLMARRSPSGILANQRPVTSVTNHQTPVLVKAWPRTAPPKRFSFHST